MSQRTDTFKTIAPQGSDILILIDHCLVCHANKPEMKDQYCSYPLYMSYSYLFLTSSRRVFNFNLIDIF